ncbi:MULTISPECIES: hypothetical protein [Actinomyces]|uniref:hypothetical protein n=1 Tax=Actinomyces TaxID=1654 RepID=UPI00109DBADD|nr:MULTISPECIES: hypothetical protein [Actinomyces]
MLALLDGTQQLTASAIAGLLWPLIQAVLYRVEWTPLRSRLVAIGAAAVLSVVIWWAGAYPATWEMLTAQAAVALGCIQTSFTLLKQWGVLDWLGAVTPGGESREAYQARHRADNTGTAGE